MLGLSGTSSYVVFVYLCICVFVFVYLYLCIFVWDTWEYQFRYPWTKSFQKMYGVYGLEHHIDWRWEEVLPMRDNRTIKKDRATQSIEAGVEFCKKLFKKGTLSSMLLSMLLKTTSLKAGWLSRKWWTITSWSDIAGELGRKYREEKPS